MAGRRKKRGGGEGEHENAERWLLTYADMITLLVAFFIMLYAMSIMNMTKFEQLATSVRSGFGGSMMNGAPNITHGGGLSGSPAIVTDSRTPQMPPAPQEFPKLAKPTGDLADQKKLDRAYMIMSAYIQKNKLSRVMNVVQTSRGVVVTVMTDKMLFAKGEADLKPDEMGLLDEIAKVVNTVPNQVSVEGHTDNLAIHTMRYPSNWELSVTRATTVLRYFEAHNVSPRRMEAAGYADQRPIVSNDSEDGRARNRRVEIVLLRQNQA
ncbi:chemotaxis protein MotB [Capsulimonas corticalis]|uniref:Chemotaxis protein MotB n=1 Tax=Capsulimonas corticalis TaxID=2219043 RepID=A0A402CPY2_9BACT|nr:flagellar motor protein MotB [Capsulimonas corticalis]BDI32767.1 chemotaxis protein MotB [Capsulimonas corticalis]